MSDELKLAQAEIARLKEELEKNSGDLSYSDLMEHSRISSFQIKEYASQITTLTQQLERAVEGLKNIKKFWDNTDTPKAYYIADQCDETLADIQKIGGKV